MKIKYGFVRIIKGTHKGKIARYVGDDENNKVRITFCYDQDFITWPIYNVIPNHAIDENITLVDIIDRYYDVVSDLNKISLKAHPKIKKYSAKHNELICECHLLRCLIKEYTSIQSLRFKEKESNVYISCSFQDLLFINDIIAELTMNRWHICCDDHEAIMPYFIENAIEMCNHFIFILSDNFCEADMIKEYQYLISHKTDLQKIIIVSLNENIKPSLHENYLFIDSKSDSDTMRQKVIALEKCFLNHDSH